MKKNLFLALMSLFLFASCGNDDVKPTPDSTFPIAEGETNWMVLNTDKAEGDTMRLYITVPEADKANVWIDLNGNGQKEEGEAVSALNSFKEYIINSSTIAVYGKITKLNCSGNNLTDLDVSNNTALENLICHGNEISTLDLSKNKALTELACTDNKLSALDLSNNNALKGLNCSRNELTSINISGAKALKYIYIYGNKITDVQEMQSIVDNLPAYAEPGNGEAVIKVVTDQNSKENKMSESQADAATTKKWTVVDSQYNDYEGEDDVPRDAYQVKLTTEKAEGEQINLIIRATGSQQANVWIDLNNNGEKDEGEGLTFTDKGKAKLEKYTLGSQTITIYGKINYLYCGRNNLTSLDVSKSTGLKFLSCNDNKTLKSLDVSNNTALTRLECANNSLSTLDVSKNTALMFLLCSRNELSALDISKATALQSIYCDNNKLKELVLAKNPALISIEIYNNEIIDEQKMQNIVDNLADFTGIERRGNLNVVYDSKTRENIINVAQVEQASAKGWLVRSSRDGDYTGIPIPEGETNWMVLKTQKAKDDKINLTIDVAEEADKAGVWIDLNANGKKDEGESVSTFNSIEEYTVDYKVIMVYGKITKFNCSGNKLDDLDVKQNPFLLNLNFDNNNIRFFNSNNIQDIKELSCSNNKMTNLNLYSNKKLESLDCSNNELPGLSNLNSEILKSLSIYGNKLNQHAMPRLIKKLPSHAEAPVSAIFKVVKTQDSKENTISKDEVGTLKTKGWKVQDSKGNDYAGE